MISPSAHVDPSAVIGKDVTIHPFAYIDAGVVIGDGCEIKPYASVMSGTTLGRNVKVYNGAIVGADPQDFRWKGGASKCSIGDNTVIREHVIINRGFTTAEGTRVGADCLIAAASHIGHDSVIGQCCVLGNGVSVAGTVTIERGTILSSHVTVHENSRIGRTCLIKGGTRISGNVPPYVIMAHNPVRYYGVNAVVMRDYANYSENDIDDVAKAYRHIYQCSTSVFNALRRIEQDIPQSAVRDEILDFVRSCNMKLVGVNLDMED